MKDTRQASSEASNHKLQAAMVRPCI